MYRVIASDMDDTLLNEKGVLSPRTVAALKRAMEAGAYVVLASGWRPPGPSPSRWGSTRR